MIEVYYLDQQIDEKAIDENFESYFDQNCQCLQFCKHLRHFLRTQQLPKKKLEHILVKLSKNELNLENKIVLSQVIKYNIKNGSKSEVSNLDDVLNSNDDKILQAEILQALIYLIEQTQYQKMQSSDKEKIKKIIDKQGLDEGKKLLIQQLIKAPQQKLLNTDVLFEINHQRDVQYKLRLVRTRENSSSYYQTHLMSQKLSIQTKNKLSIKRLNKKTLNLQQTLLPVNLQNPTQNVQGSDRQKSDSQYNQIQKLYQKVVSNQDLIKDKDQIFLVKVLTNRYNRFENTLQILLGCRMIISIVLDLTKRTTQNRQQISQQFYEQIIQFCSSQQDIIKKLFNKKEDKIYKSIQKRKLQINQPNEIEKEAQTQFKEDYPQQFLINQIYLLRCQATQAIYNLIEIQKAQIVSEKLCLELQNNIKDQDDEFKSISFQLYTLLEIQFYYVDVFKNCFPQIISRNKQTEMCCYQLIREYAKNKQVCTELFNAEKIQQLCSYIIEQEQGKLNCCQLLNICLQNDLINGLDQTNVNKLISQIFLSKEFDVKHEIIITILYISKLNPKLISKDSINQLATRLNEFNENPKIFKNIITILGIISQFQQIESLDVLSCHLTNQEQLEDDNVQIQFENQIIDIITVQFVICEIIQSHQVYNSIGSSLVIQNIINALENENTTDNIKLLIAKIMQNIDNLNLDQENLQQKFQVFIQGHFLDLAQQIAIVYTNQVKRISRENVIIDYVVLQKCQSISNQFAIHPIEYCQITVNNIGILKNQINILQVINQDQADVIILFLQRNDNYLETIVINILQEYATKKILIPESIIEVIGDLKNNQQQWIILIESIIDNGQSVTYIILTKLVNFLYFNEDFSDSAFKILKQANFNQDLPDEIFFPLEIERAADSINNKVPVKQNAIKFLLIQVQKGNRLTINAFKSLKQDLENDLVLDILIQISKTKQIIPNYLIERMVQFFNQNATQIKIIQLFKYICNNNQEIIPEIVQKLEDALNNMQLNDEVLLFFTSYGQGNQKLSRKVIQQIYNRLQSNPSQELKLELLNTLIYQIDKIQQDPIAIGIIRNQIQSELHANNVNSLILEGIYKIINKGCMNEQLNDLLIKQLQTQSLSQEHMLKIYNILSSNGNLNNNQNNILKLFKINQLPSNEFFIEIQAFKNKCLIPQNFDKLKQILQENPDNIFNIIEVLDNCKNQKDIPQDLLERIIFQSNSFHQVPYKRFKDFILRLVESQVKFTQFALSSLSNSKDEQFSSNIISQIQSYQSFQDFSKSFFQANHPKDSKKLSVLELEEKLQKDLNFSNQIILKYTKLILKGKWINLEMTAKSLFEKRHLIVTNNNKNLILICLSFISQSKNIIMDEDILKYFYENLINQNNDLITRSMSFRGLQSAIQSELQCNQFKDCQACFSNNSTLKLVLSEFLTYCICRIKSIEEKQNVKLELDFHQIEILLLIPYLYYSDDNIINNNQKNFSILLLKQNLFSKLILTQQQEQIFEVICNNFDQNQQNQLGKILQLILDIKFDKFQQILDLFNLIQDMEENEIFSILYFENDPQLQFKYKWIKKQIKKKFTNQQLQKDYDIIVKLPIASMKQLLKIEGNYFEFKQLIIFIDEYNLFDFNQLQQEQNTNYKQILGLSQKQYLIEQINYCKSKNILIRVITVLIDQFDWKFEDLQNIFEAGLNKNKNKKDQSLEQNCFIRVLEILSNFNISPKDHLKYTDIFCKPYEDWEHLAYKCCLQIKFPESIYQKRDLQKLIDQFINLNEYPLQFDLIEIVQKIKNAKSMILVKKEAINNWQVEYIQEWIQNMKKSQSYISSYKTAITRKFSFELTDNQLISAYLALFEQKGTLLQVRTGEGKSKIICIIAIIKALEGRKVDIITSSPILAQRDAIENERLYKMFQLTCSSNNDASIQNIGPKKCYACDIVYGDVSQFQFDYLRDNYLKINTLNGRSQEFVIIDEVDSMLIDESSKISKLSSKISGLDLLKPIYIKLWQLFQQKLRQIIKIENCYYCFEGKISFKGDLITLENYEHESNKFYISDLKQYIEKKQSLSKIGRVISEDVSIFISRIITQDINVYIKDLNIPKSFESIIKIQLPKWIKNLFVANAYKEKIQYVIQNGMIKPVDYLYTGLILDSTNWQDGLHQFLQIKHGLRVTSESFTSNFLSNICYFKKYKNNIIGLTGTLGSKHAQNVLKDIYDVCILKIPDMAEKKFIEYPILILPDRSQQIEEIRNSAIYETKQQRAVLIISETISFAENIYQCLLKGYESRFLKLYHMNNMNQEQKIQNISQGEIIIATNLAGRGTDIKADSIQNQGGIQSKKYYFQFSKQWSIIFLLIFIYQSIMLLSCKIIINHLNPSFNYTQQVIHHRMLNQRFLRIQMIWVQKPQKINQTFFFWYFSAENLKSYS